MSDGHGKDCDFLVSGRDLGQFLKSIDIQLMAELHETTTMKAEFVTRKGGLFDSKLAADGLYEGGTDGMLDQVNDAFDDANATVSTAWPLGATAIGDLGFGLRGHAAGYKCSIPCQNIITTSASWDGDDDIDLLECLHPLGAETGTGHSASLNHGASSPDGGCAYIECPDFTGTSITVTIEHSDDDLAWSTLATFTAIDGDAKSQRVEFAGTVKQYTRESRSGTFTTATYVVGIRRN